MNIRHPRLLTLIGLLAAMPVAISFAAPGDKLLNAANPGLGQPNNLDPYFLDYNRGSGMAALSNGGVVVVWSERGNTSAPVPTPNSPDGVDGKDYACFFRIYGPTGTVVSAATRPYLDINADGTGRQNTPIVAALTGGGFVMTWNSANGPGDTYSDGNFGGDTWARVYDNSGTAVTGTFRVNDGDPNGVPDTQEPVAVVGLSGGGFAILWSDENDNAAGLGATLSNTDDFFLRVFAANGTPAAASARLGGVGQDAFFKDYQAFGGAAQGMIALSNNTVVVGWGVRDQSNDGTGVSPDGTAPNGGGASYFQVFNASGAAVSSQTAPYLDINANGSGSQLAPALAPLSGGGFAVVWNSNHNTDDGGNSDTGLGFNGTTGGDTYVRVYTNAGASTSSTVRVNDLRTDDSETPSAIKPLTDGGFAIVWKEDDDNTAAPLLNTDDYYARSYNANGTPRNPSILIGGSAADALFEDIDANGHGMAALSDGGYAVAIRVRDSANNGTGTSLDGTAPAGGYSAAVRIFNADGTARTAPFFPYGDINPDFSGNQNIPLICAMAGGGFAVTWHSNNNTNDTENDQPTSTLTSDGGDAYTRIYNNSGVALHGTVQAHGEGASEPTGTIDQQDPFAILPLTGGNYAIVVRDDNDNTNNKDDIFLSIFEGVPTGPVATAPTVTTAAQSAVTASSATLGGNVTADGGATVTERGIVWKTSTGPTTADNKVQNGSGTGAFSGTVGSLPANTTIFVRAYAINSVNTSYGNEISFVTLPAPTTITSLNRVNPATTNLSTVNWTLTFAAANTGVTASNFTLTGAAASGASVGAPTTGNSGLTWNVPVTTGSASGTLTLNLANATGTTPGVSTALPFAGQPYTMDKTAPALASAITITDTALIVGDTATVTFTFTEAVSGFTTADVTVPNGTLSGLSSSDGGITWNATLTPNANIQDSTNLLSVNNTGYTDAVGNAGTGSTNSVNYAIDTRRPTATIVVADNALSIGETSLVTFTFSEAVTGFTNADLTVANGTLTSVSSGDGGITWTATFTPSASVTSPTNVITLANTGITDAVGNAGTGSTNSNNYAIDTVRPTATIVVADNALSIGETSLVTFTFNEAVTGFTNADLTIPNGTLTSVSSGNGITWTATFTPTAGITAPTNAISLNNTGVADLAGNAGAGSTSSNNYAIATEPVADIPVTLATGALNIDASGSAGAANIILSYATGPGGPFLEIFDPGRTLGAPSGGVQVNPNTVRIPLASLTSITLTGSALADTFMLNFNDGDICPAGGINVVGGGPAVSPGDELIIDGDFNSGGTYGPSGVGAGTLTLDSGNTVTFTGLEPVDMSLASFTTFTVNVDPTSTVTGNVTTTVAAVDAGVNTEITFSGGLESVKLGAVTTALIINGDTVDNDYFMLQGLGSAMVGDFSVDGLGGNADVVDIHDTTITLAGLNKDFSAKADFVGLGRQSSASLVGNLVCSGDITLESDGDISGTPALWAAGGVWGTTRPVYFNSTPIAAERGSVAVGGAISKASGADATCTIKAKSAVVLPLGGTIISTSNKLHIVLHADTDATNGGAVSIAQQNIIRSNEGNIIMGGGADPATTPAIGSTTGGNLNFGVNISSSEVTSAGGNISIRGTGRAANNCVGVNIAAQQLVAGTVVNSGSGTLTIVGTGGGNFTGASGVRLAGAANASAPLDAAAFYSAKILSSTGTISVNGITAAGNNIGITAGNWTEVSASGVANINVSGTGFGTGAGISLSPVANVSTHLGNITSTSSISSVGGNVTLTADKMALNAGTGTESIATSGTGNVTLKPLTAALAIDLGSAVDTASALELGALELDNITAPTLVIGDSASGSINVSAVISPLNFKTLALANNTAFAATGGFASTVTSNSVYGKVTVTGTVNIAAGAAFTATPTGGYIWNGTDTFTLLDNDASDVITGTITPVAIPNLLGSALTGIIRYNVGTNANDITIGSMSIIEGWRQTYFSSTENAGNAANTADSDNDGKSNLLEFAFGTIPTNIGSGPGDLVYTGTLAGNGTLTATGQHTTVFEPTANNVDFRALFVRRKDYIAAGLTYTPQFSVDMGTWQDSSAIPTVLADDGTWQVVSIPYTRSIGGRKARFFRMSVSIAP